MPADLPLTEVRIETERLVLRPPIRADIPAIVEGIGDFEVSRNLSRVPYPYGPADAEAWLGMVERNRADGGLNLAVALEDRLIGVLGVRRPREGGMFGYWLARPCWGSGYATEAARAFLGHVFGLSGVQTIRSGIFADNPASLRVQEKLGFVRTGTSHVYSLARQVEVEHIDTLLTKARFLEFGQR